MNKTQNRVGAEVKNNSCKEWLILTRSHTYQDIRVTFHQRGIPNQVHQTEYTTFNMVIIKKSNTPQANNSNKVLSSSLSGMNQNQGHRDNDAGRGGSGSRAEEVAVDTLHWNTLGTPHTQVAAVAEDILRTAVVELMSNRVAVVLTGNLVVDKEIRTLEEDRVLRVLSGNYS